MRQAWMPLLLHARKYLVRVNVRVMYRAMFLTIDEGVQDGHCTIRDSGVRVDLLED
jgi:hypothetical protein